MALCSASILSVVTTGARSGNSGISLRAPHNFFAEPLQQAGGMSSVHCNIKPVMHIRLKYLFQCRKSKPNHLMLWK